MSTNWINLNLLAGLLGGFLGYAIYYAFFSEGRLGVVDVVTFAVCFVAVWFGTHYVMSRRRRKQAGEGVSSHEAA